ncbi:DUF397 domain-containing protein [Streptomyces sp. NPDC007903]|uniref:DUF397 domain-containing protein n=1 Tax=Streptomyces sp. NPDC007903 TaxID=3364786 RepID=UPI0036E8826B
MTSTLRWFKSSYSDSTGGQCVETAYTWHKSSYSDSTGGNCIEVASCPTTIHVRDSKQTDGPLLAVTPTAWTTFLTDARRG